MGSEEKKKKSIDIFKCLLASEGNCKVRRMRAKLRGTRFETK